MENYIMYLRKSRTDSEYESESVETTLMRHKERLMELCSHLGINCDTVLQEVGSADSITARPEMIRLLQMVETGAYDGVVCIDMDRLSRGSGADQALVINTFKYSDTKVITPQKTYDFALETDEQFAELSLFLAKQEYRQIKKRLTQGRLDSAKEGKFASSTTPYGYERVKIKGQKGYVLKIYPPEADFVRMVYHDYATSGRGTGYLAHKYADMGYCTRNGNPVNKNFLCYMLTNPVYLGKIRWNYIVTKKTVKDGDVVNSKKRNKSPILVSGLHEAIIDQETFDIVQSTFEKNDRARVRDDQTLKNPFSRLLFCGVCGKAMASAGSYSDGGRGVHCRTSGCPCCGNRVDIIEDRILLALDDWMKGTRFEENKKDNANGIRNTIESLSAKKKAAELKLTRQMDAYENGDYGLEEYRSRSEKTRSEIKVLTEQLAIFTDKMDEAEKNAEQQRSLMEKLDGFSAKYRSLKAADEKNTLLKSVLDHVDYKRIGFGSTTVDNFEIILYPKLKS